MKFLRVTGSAAMSLATILSFSFTPGQSYGGSLWWMRKGESNQVFRDYVGEWAKSPGKVGEMASTARKSTREGSGMHFFGDRNSTNFKDLQSGQRRSAEGYGVIGTKPGQSTSEGVIHFPQEKGGISEIELNGLSKSSKYSEVEEVSARLPNGEKPESMSLYVKSTKPGQKEATREVAKEDFYQLRRTSEGSLIPARIETVVRDNNQIIRASESVKGDGVTIALISKNADTFKTEIQVGSKGNIVNIDAEINGRVVVDVMDSSGSVHRHTYQVEAGSLPPGSRQGEAKATQVGRATVTKDGLKKLGLEAKVKTYPAATSVPSGGSVQGLKVAPAAGAQ